MEPKQHRALPIGFRFRPSDYELSNYFLKKKALGEIMKARTIIQECHDIFSKHPRDLPGYPKEEHWYYYCRNINDQTTSNSSNIWTLISEGTNVLDTSGNGEVVGIKRSFTTVEPEEEEKEESHDICLSDEEEEEETPKFKWFMDEFSLPLRIADTDLILCHVFRTNIVDLPIIESDSEEEEEESEPDSEEEEEEDEEEEEEEEEEEDSAVAESFDIAKEKDGSVVPPSPSPP